MKRTLGGDRLGSGKKMNVDLHGYERSTHDLGYLWRSSAAAGTLIPFMSKVALPGDTFDINLNCEVMTHPTVGPLFGSYKVQLDVFFAPIRLYQGLLHNNKLKIAMEMAQIKLPLIRLTGTKISTAPDPDNAQINPSCILSYLGIRGVGSVLESAEFDNYNRDFNAVPLLAYWDTYKNYYANKQEEIGAVIHSENLAPTETVTGISIDGQTIPQQGAFPDTNVDTTESSIIQVDYAGAQPIPSQILFSTSQGTLSLQQLGTNFNFDTPNVLVVTYNNLQWGSITVYNWRYITAEEISTVPPEVVTFPLENLDQMREFLLQQISGTNVVIINNALLEPYAFLTEFSGGRTNLTNTQEGLAIKTYQSDLFNNWLNTEWIDGTNGISEVTSIDTSGGSFTMDTLNLTKKVYEMLNRMAVSGGTYQDWIEVQYDHQIFLRTEIPVYHGGLIKELVFQEVISNTKTDGQPLGTLAGKGVLSKKHKGGQVTIKVDEPGYILGIFSLTPRLDNSQGNSWDVNLKTLDDLHKPALDEIGFQELITEQMTWWDTTNDGSIPNTWTQKSAGKQPAWINYMTSVNEVRGNFAIADNEMFMTLNRRYEPNALGTINEIADLTTYIDPAKFNHIFAETALDAQNFWVQIAVDITARRKMSAKIMPNL